LLYDPGVQRDELGVRAATRFGSSNDRSKPRGQPSRLMAT
jgi:hypothetical protein